MIFKQEKFNYFIAEKFSLKKFRCLNWIGSISDKLCFNLFDLLVINLVLQQQQQQQQSSKHKCQFVYATFTSLNWQEG